MKVVYFADDGTRFEDENECEQYERRQSLQQIIRDTKFFNEHGEYMMVEDWLAEPDACDYMDVATNEEAQAIYDYLRNDIGLCHPWADWRVDNPTKGRYYYSHGDDKWHNLDEEFDRVHRIMAIFEG